MSPKPSITIDHQCQHISLKGNRCHMLIDENHRTPQGSFANKPVERAARRLQQSTNSAVVVRTDGQTAAGPNKDSAGGQA